MAVTDRPDVEDGELYTKTVIGENTGREWVYFYPTPKRISAHYMAAPRGDGLCDLDKWR